ncbi:MAG: MGMT family protein [Rhodothermales bacterium]
MPAKKTETNFFEQVWDVVAEIPMGKVTTYGDIATYLGKKGAARTVGWAMKAAGGKGLPCHRVVNKAGVLTASQLFETPYLMEERLRSEGITFKDNGNIDMKSHLWVPGSGGDFVD